ncbi:MTH938/NDUFAF3 family protein [Elusimicrobiota bacterium]
MHIDSYNFGNIVIDGKEYKCDVLITGDRIKSWWRKEGHMLQVVDLEAVFNEKPEVLVIGCGASGIMKIKEEVAEKCGDLGIELFSLNTGDAVEKFNEVNMHKKTACGLHLTC